MFDTNIPDTTIRTLPLPDETDLLARVAEGNDRAFETIFHHYRPKIYSYAYQLFGNIQMADELVQEVFLKVWLNRDKLPTSSSSTPGSLLSPVIRSSIC